MKKKSNRDAFLYSRIPVSRSEILKHILTQNLLHLFKVIIKILHFKGILKDSFAFMFHRASQRRNEVEIFNTDATHFF